VALATLFSSSKWRSFTHPDMLVFRGSGSIVRAEAQTYLRGKGKCVKLTPSGRTNKIGTRQG
jgi:hypothetical protein